MDETDFADHVKELDTESFTELPNGISLSLTKTRYGTISLMFDREIQEHEFKKFFVGFFAKLKGIPTSFDEVSRLIELPEDALFNITIDVEDGGVIAGKAEEEAAKAMKYFIENLSGMFAETLQRYLEETFLRTLMHKSADYFDLPKTEVEAFDFMMRMHRRAMRERMKIRKASGRKTEWTIQKLDALLSGYEEVLPVLRQAKKLYSQVKKNFRWREIIKTAYPQLSANVIEELALRGKSSEPAVLALAAVAERFETEPSDYLKTLLVKARRHRRHHVRSQNN